MCPLHAPKPAFGIAQQEILTFSTNVQEQSWGADTRLQRRTWMKGLLATGLWKAGGALAQGENTRNPVIAQVVDMSPGQQDVSRDFLTGSRAAWQDINARGGIQGRPVQHVVLETDGTAAQVQSAWQTAYRMSQCVALAGCVGHQVASLLARHQSSTDATNPLPLIAPWLHQTLASSTTDTVFDVFADQRAQITHALKSLASMGVTELGVAYSAGQDTTQAQQSVSQAAQEQNVKVRPVGNGSSLAQPIVLFIGGTPELHAFLGKLKLPAGRQCYVIALADVNLQVLAQMGGLPPRISVIATQTVPLVTSSIAIVRSYRETLARLYDEPPSPQGLAGFIAARYTAEVLQQTSGALQRSAVLSSLQQRRSVNLGGWNVSYQDKKRLAAFVTQSMLSPDGRIVG
ncbi:ABC transporter substrate-binding protein [Acidovorax sp. DW039]|uniref:ABC transporter substrate-binding protein n=1 Tax=Acidovorax sp. DW039 TaxID=3095606 RepID=UPI00308CD422|nr:ABC transporter substrate-binding protein [Acidovorax sp. DW039]